ncbi:hypothetical protein [Acanthopleuribacter pedis]|uniref:hypothetical protein n=1 Tax=Acanthopleuribacter pedis TaxID=442870 RepID=UPI001A9F7368|nr:hypothetical protein [Acanthopleuribacter pedis]
MNHPPEKRRIGTHEIKKPCVFRTGTPIGAHEMHTGTQPDSATAPRKDFFCFYEGGGLVTTEFDLT